MDTREKKGNKEKKCTWCSGNGWTMGMGFGPGECLRCDGTGREPTDAEWNQRIIDKGLGL